MSVWQESPYDSVARKWLDLAERRRGHLLDVLESGRWHDYVLDATLEDQLYELDLVCARFAEALERFEQIASA
ncbi:MAG: hypothetical protein ACRECV_08380 [Xanthobacteraceae bacterium]